jgi:hypothetical protein
MGGGQFVATAVPVAGTLALLCLLLVGIAALHLARRLRRDVEPLFPDVFAPERDPVAFTHRLTEGGSLDEDTARFADIAARSGFDEAYALLGLATRDEDTTQPPAASPSVPAELRRAPLSLATVEDDRRRAAFASLAAANRETPELEMAPAATSRPRAESGPAIGRTANVDATPNPAHAPEADVAPETDGAAGEPAAVRSWQVASADDDLLPSLRPRGRAA